MKTTVKTAAGEIAPIASNFSAQRGGTRLFFGTLPDGRFVVASRFQVELRATDRARAEKRFKELCQ